MPSNDGGGHAFGGGRPTKTFRPVRHDGRTLDWGGDVPPDTELIGSHTGDFVGLNVANPRPGKVYQWAGSDPASMRNERAKGGRPVQLGEDGAQPAYVLGVDDRSDTPTPLDSGAIYQDVVLVEYDEDRMAARHEELRVRSERAVYEAERQFTDAASPAELAAAQGRGSRFARRDHVLQRLGEGGRIEEQITPRKGIIDNG